MTTKKFLGIVIDQYLLDETTIWTKYVKKSAVRYTRAIRRLKPYVTRETLVSVYYALVQQYFDYGCLVWEPVGATLSSKLQSFQNGAARVILGYRNKHGQLEAALYKLQ